MACLAQSVTGAKDVLLLLHTHAHKARHQTVMKSEMKEQGQSAGAPFDVFDMRDHPKNRDHEGDCKWRCNNNDRCARYEYDAITLICNMFEQSKDHLNQSAPFDVFDMRDHKKNRDNEGDCKWRCDNNYRCVRYEYDASTLFCKMFEKSEDVSNHGALAFDVFDMRDHKKNRDNEGDCKWRCDNNYRCARYEYDAGTLFCKLFEKSKDDSHQSAPFDVFDMRNHPKNRDHEGYCKWKCDVNDRCAQYEYDAVTLICKLFEKYHVEQDGKHTLGDDDNEDTEENDGKTSKNGSKHDTDKGDKDDKDDKENSKKVAKDDKANNTSKQVAKRNFDQSGNIAKKENEAKKNTNLVSDEKQPKPSEMDAAIPVTQEGEQKVQAADAPVLISSRSQDIPSNSDDVPETNLLELPSNRQLESSQTDVVWRLEVNDTSKPVPFRCAGERRILREQFPPRGKKPRLQEVCISENVAGVLPFGRNARQISRASKSASYTQRDHAAGTLKAVWILISGFEERAGANFVERVKPSAETWLATAGDDRVFAVYVHNNATIEYLLRQGCVQSTDTFNKTFPELTCPTRGAPVHAILSSCTIDGGHTGTYDTGPCCKYESALAHVADLVRAENIDWIYIADDDLYMHTPAITKLLEAYDASEPLAINSDGKGSRLKLHGWNSALNDCNADIPQGFYYTFFSRGLFDSLLVSIESQELRTLCRTMGRHGHQCAYDTTVGLWAWKHQAKFIPTNTLTNSLTNDHDTSKVTFTFNGKMGIVCGDDGIVQEVIDNKPAHAEGIRAGDKIVNVRTKDFSKERLRSAETSGSDYDVTVRGIKPVLQPILHGVRTAELYAQEHTRWMSNADLQSNALQSIQDIISSATRVVSVPQSPDSCASYFP